MHFRNIIILFFIIFIVKVKAQTSYIEKTVKELTSAPYNGRGYTFDGMLKASFYLNKEFKRIGLKPFGKSYLQTFDFPVNVINNAELMLNGEQLVYGKDFIVKPSSKSIQSNRSVGSYLFHVEDFVSSFASKEKTIAFIQKDEREQQAKNIIMPALFAGVDSIRGYYKQWANTYENNRNVDRAIIRFVTDSLTASLSQRQANVAEFIVKNKYYNDPLQIDHYAINAEFNPNFSFNNVIGYVDGKNNDSVVVITAHYDHLGQVGDVIFPGASDNASGTAMVLDLAKHYVKNKPKYRTVFMLFGAEEAGIVGALKYVEQPLFPLGQIKFLVNLDIMGAGEDGIQVVNGTKYKPEFDQLVRINTKEGLLKQVKSRGESCNSDHCPFDAKGVPSFFIYTLGGKGNYHNVYDTYANLDLSYASKIKSLLIKFINQL